MLLLLALLQSAPDPQFHARFDTPTSATVSWAQQARGCLYVTHITGEQAFIGCYDGSGRVNVALGHQGPVSGDVRPTIGDVYLASIDGATYRARLAWWRYLAAFRG